MLSRAARPGPARAEAGFSIIELMTVLFIIAVVTSMVILTLPRRQPSAELEAASLAIAIERASEQALVSGIAHGIDVGQRGYAIVLRQDGNWVQVAGSAHRLESGVTLVRGEGADGQAEDGPHFIFDPLGTALGEPLTLSGGETRITLTLAPNGNVSLQGGDDVRRQ